MQKKSRKIILGLLTAWPIIYLILFIIFIISFFPLTGNDDFFYYSNLFILMIIHIGTMVYLLGLFIFYLSHLYNFSDIDRNKRIMWIILFVIGNAFAMLVYWYQYIWKNQSNNI